MADKKMNFESSLMELETIVKQLESGTLSLDESLSNFEKGVTLTKFCLKSLEDAEQKIMILTKENGETTLKEFEVQDD